MVVIGSLSAVGGECSVLIVALEFLKSVWVSKKFFEFAWVGAASNKKPLQLGDGCLSNDCLR